MTRRVFAPRPTDAGRLWNLGISGTEPLEGGSAGDILLVPSETILILSVPLPLNSHRERLQALPYAIEDRIGDPPESVHLALSRDKAGDAYLACVVDHAIMQRWIDGAAQAGVGHAAIVPDALALPVPPQGEWSLARCDGRTIVRRPDGSGFACADAQFSALWSAGGKPMCVEAPLRLPSTPVLDLRQGNYAAHDLRWRSAGRKIALVAAAGIAAHGAIAVADTILLKAEADRRGAEMLAEMRIKAPGLYNGSDSREAAGLLSNLLPAGGTVPQGRLLPLLVRSGGVLAPQRAALNVKSIDFSEQTGTLRYEVARGDAVDAARKALSDAGLREGVRISVASENPS